jgi:hypothetical protein
MPNAIAAAVHVRITAREPALDSVTRHYLEALTPERWAIEWNLPAWLGRSFGLDARTIQSLVHANVAGLLAIRAEDDLMDDEVGLDEVEITRRLATYAMEEAVAIYRARFPASSPVWEVFVASIARWRKAGAASEPDAEPASRGAPIQIAAYACCLLGDRLDAWPPLRACLDHAVAALVLYDQFADWEADLAAGRSNGFVRRATTAPQDVRHADRTRAAVLTAMLTSDVVAEHFAAALLEAAAAETLARRLGISELADFLHHWRNATEGQGASVADHYMAIGDKAARLLGSPNRAATTVGGPG